MKIDCICQLPCESFPPDAIGAFSEIHTMCPALREILIPDLTLWQQALLNLPRDSSRHRSILLWAFERGCLGRLTLPIHKYLLNGSSPRSDLQNQYIQDLQELWFLGPDALRRHRRSRSYLGRLSELLVVDWAESIGGRITGLEATGSNHDILAVSPDGAQEAIEVKFIGTQDSDFERLLTERIFGGAGDLPSASDFLLVKIYEAAQQLKDWSYKKTAVVVIDDFIACNIFEAALTIGYVDLSNPRLRSQNPIWCQFLETLRKRYPVIDSDFGHLVLSLSEVRIFRLVGNGTLQEIPFGVGRPTRSN